MASERPTDNMLDLLYDELTDEERSETLSEVEGHEELRAEYESYRQMLSDIDAEMPSVDPPASVHASLMQAAREQATESVEETARAVRRPPRHAEGKGFWGKIASSQMSQIALVATVLLVGAFMFKMGGPAMDEAMAPGQIPLEERPVPSFQSADEVAVEAAPVEEEPEPEGAEEGLAAAGEPAEEVDTTAELQRNEPVGRTQKGLDARAKRDRLTDNLAETAKREDSSLDSVLGSERAKPEPKRAPKKREAKPRVRSRSASKSASAKDSNDTLNLFDGESGSRAGNEQSGYAAPREDAPSAPEAEPAPSTAQRPVDSDREEATAEQQAYRPQPGTIASVEEYYSTGDYRQTVSEADKVLSSSATTTQKARAIELKAQAYRRMNQLNRADTLYKNLQSNYPDYAPARVRQARSEIQKILTQKRQPAQKKRKAKPTYEFDDSMEMDSTPALD